MTDQFSLKDTERKVFISSFQDGLIDIFIGCWALMFVIGPSITPSLGDFLGSAVFVPFWAMLFVVLWMIRKHVVKPRMGAVKFGSWRRARLFKFSRLMLLVCTLALILGAASAIRFEFLAGWTHLVRFSLVFLVGFGLAGYFLDFSRLYAYGIMIAAAPLIGELLYRKFQFPHHGFPVAFGIAATVIIATGVCLFIRFLLDHPLENSPGPAA
jgi:hypothetical protein